MSRRKFLRLGVGVATVATVGGTAALLWPREITYEQALSNPELRQTWLEQTCKGWPEFARVVYDSGRQQLRERMTRRGKPSLTLTFDTAKPDSYNLKCGYVPWEPGEIEQRREMAGIANTSPDDIFSFATGQRPTLYISDAAFSQTKEFFTAGLRELYFRSMLGHERQHAIDFYNGIDFGNGHLIDNETARMLMAYELHDRIMEARGFASQASYLAAEVRQVHGHVVEEFRRYIREVEESVPRLPERLGNVHLRSLADYFLQQQYGDPLLGQLLKKKEN